MPFNNRCYHIAIDVWLKLPNADNTCKALLSDLVGIESEAEQQFIVNEIETRLRARRVDPFAYTDTWRKQFWTSGRRHGLGWVWNQTRIVRIPTSDKQCQDKLNTFKPMTFTAWRKGEPSNVYEQGVTVIYRQGQWGWNDFVEVDDLSFICEREIYGDEGELRTRRAFILECSFWSG